MSTRKTVIVVIVARTAGEPVREFSCERVLLFKIVTQPVETRFWLWLWLCADAEVDPST
jgi:hypothetical protein